jgi:large repetitive protein
LTVRDLSGSDLPWNVKIDFESAELNVMAAVGFRYLPVGGRNRRLLSGCLSALIALAGTISLTAGIAEAAVPAAILITGSPDSPMTASATTPTTLTWTFNAPASEAFCELVRADTVVAARAACSATASYPVSDFGNYTFELFRTATDVQPTASSPITVAPPAPKVTVRAIPTRALTSRVLATPQWRFVLLPGATATCTLIGPHGKPVAAPARCVSPYSVSAPSPAVAAAGRYTLAVTQAVSGIPSSAATSSFALRARAVQVPAVRPVARPALKPAILLPPSVPTVTADSPSGTSPNPTFTVVYDAGSDLECSVSDRTQASVFSCGATTTLDLSNAPPGTYTLTVDATDPVGGGTSAAASADYDYEPDPPATPVVTAQAGPGNDRTPTFTVTDADDTGSNLTYHCTVAGPASVTVADSACGATTIPKLKSDPDGTYTLSVTATSGSGLTSGAGSDSYTLDTTTPQPTVNQTSPVTSAAASSTVTYDISSTETPDGPDTFSCVWAPPTGTAPAASPCPADGTFTATNGNGLYTLTVTGADTVGNTNSTTTTYTYDDATGVPVVNLTSGESTPSPAASVTYTFTATELLNGPDAFSCDWALSGGTDPGPSPCSSPATFAAPVDGDYTLTVVATDLIGNQQQTVVSYRRDSSTPPPVVALVGPELTPSSLATPSFTITDPEGPDGPDTFSCDWVSPKGVDSGALPCGASYTYDVSKLGTGRNGVYALTVTATDGAGNINTSTFAYTYDASTPAPVVALGTGQTTPSASFPVSYTITDSEALDGPDKFSCDWVDPHLVDSGPVDCSSGVFAVTAAGGDGTYTLTVTATDKLLNSAKTVVTYQLDTMTPAPVVAFGLLQQSLSNVPSPQFAISDGEAGDTFVCLWVAPSGATISNAACSAAPSLPTAGHGDGVYQLTVTAFDALGNSAPASSPLAYTYDSSTPAPTVTLMNPTSSPSNVSGPTYSIVDSEVVDTFTCTWTEPDGTEVGGDSCSSGHSFATPSDGTYTLQVTATDAAGNSRSTLVQYVFDDVRPGVPYINLRTAVKSNINDPTWIWGYAFNDSERDYSVTCLVRGPAGYSVSIPYCHSPLTVLLGGGDGRYAAKVVLTDAAGNTSSSVWAYYVLDSQAPPGPSVSLISPAGAPASTDRHPVWSVTAPRALQALSKPVLSCTLLRGGHHGTVIVGPETCPDPTTFDLSDRSDGMFTLEVRTITVATGETSAPAWSWYIVVPDPPVVHAPSGQDPRAVWTVEGNQRDPWDCTLSHDGSPVVDQRPCSGSPTYNMTGRPTGRYTLKVVQEGARQTQSEAGSASWVWQGSTGPIKPTGTTRPGQTVHHMHHPKPPILPIPTGALGRLPHPSKGLAGPVRTILRIPPQLDKAGGAAAQSVKNLVSTIGRAGGGSGFPLLLLGFVLVFIVVQNRIDRRDPKLALASIAADDQVEFQPPPSRRERP